MPLRDHFHSPWREENHWEGFHSAWANTLVRHLNGFLLPKHYRAVPQVHLGMLVESDVATFEEIGMPDDSVSDGGAADATATATAVWAPPQPAQSVAVEFPDQDIVEVRVLDQERGTRLVAAIEIVSPGNKDRPESRRAFASKCAAYLQQRVGLIVIDIVTSRSADYRHEIFEVLARPSVPQEKPGLSANAYRIVPKKGRSYLETWPETLSIGLPLPSVPLWLACRWPIRIDLEESYQETCRVLRIPESEP